MQDLVCIFDHGPKLQEVNGLAIFANSTMCEQNRSGAVKENQEWNDHPDRQEQDKEGECHNNIKNTFCFGVGNQHKDNMKLNEYIASVKERRTRDIFLLFL